MTTTASSLLPPSLPNKTATIASGWPPLRSHVQSVSCPLPFLVWQALYIKYSAEGVKRTAGTNQTLENCSGPIELVAGISNIFLSTTQTQDFLSSGVFTEQVSVTGRNGTSCSSCLLTGSFSSCHFFCNQIHAWPCCLPPNMIKL